MELQDAAPNPLLTLYPYFNLVIKPSEGARALLSACQAP